MTREENYSCMPRPVIEAGELQLRALQPTDIEAVRSWRNAQLEVLRQSQPISSEEQLSYFEQEVWPDKKLTAPRQILLAIELQQALVGYGGLTHISWRDRRAEVSFLLSPGLEGDAPRRARVFFSFLTALGDFAFHDLNLRRLFTETFANRHAHLATLESAGFKREGRLRAHVVIDGEPVDSIVHGLLADGTGAA
jgi:RimJ/RimL family protein N-acetyltransferase